MRALLSMILLATLMLLPPVQAQDEVAATIAFHETAPPQCDCPTGWFTLNEWEPGQSAQWRLNLPGGYHVIDILVPDDAFAVTRVQQVVPLLHEAGQENPLFGYFPRPDVWSTQSHVRLYHHVDTDDGTILRLGIPGPSAGTLRIERDVAPPGFELGPVHGVTHYGFRQNTTTDEYALGDLRWRRAGTDDAWVVNPTPSHHTNQVFPIQGLDPDTTYTVQAVFTDWAGNEATSATYEVRTRPAPTGAPVTITPLSPPDGSTNTHGNLEVAATITAPDASIAPEAVRLFVDLEEVPDGFTFDGTMLRYQPSAPFTPGLHVVSVEAMSTASGSGQLRWTFSVGDMPEEVTTSAAPTAPALVAMIALAVLLLGRRA